MVTSGFFFTMTFCVEVNVPQELVADKVMAYVPGLLKMKDGLTELAVEPFAKLQLPAVPQKPAV